MNDKVVVITGAAKGIGRGIAEVFASEGATLTIADIDEQVGRATAAELADRTGAAVEFVRADVTSRESCEAAVQAVLDAHGRIGGAPGGVVGVAARGDDEATRHEEHDDSTAGGGWHRRDQWCGT